MIIDRIAKQLLADANLSPLVKALAAHQDATLSVGQSGRALMLASLWAKDPRPCLYVVSGEELADRAARTLQAWLGLEQVERYPMREDLPWKDTKPNMAVLGARTQAPPASRALS